MKYLKTFEEINITETPEEGDYVACELIYDNGEINFDNLGLPQSKDYEIKLAQKFISENVGQYINYNKTYNTYYVEYENIPVEISDFFNNSNYRYMDTKEILFWSKDREEVQNYQNAYLASKKYNI